MARSYRVGNPVSGGCAGLGDGFDAGLAQGAADRGAGEAFGGEFARVDGHRGRVQALIDNGVKHIFGYPGGAVLPIYDELFQQEEVQHILLSGEDRCRKLVTEHRAALDLPPDSADSADSSTGVGALRPPMSVCTQPGLTTTAMKPTWWCRRRALR